MPSTPNEMLSAVSDWLAARTGRSLRQATHKVSLRDVGEVDAEIVQLLRAAYEQNA
jgi:hypothetical protein